MSQRSILDAGCACEAAEASSPLTRLIQRFSLPGFEFGVTPSTLGLWPDDAFSGEETGAGSLPESDLRVRSSQSSVLDFPDPEGMLPLNGS